VNTRPFSFLALLAVSLVAVGSLHAQSEFFGYTEAYRIAKMSFAETGVIVEMNAKVGDIVPEGQILSRLDYKVLEQELKMAEEQLRIRQLRFDRLSELQTKGHVPKEEFERAKSDLAIDAAKVERTKAQIENRTLRSPFKGVISEVKKEVSESISANGAHIITVVQTDKLQVNLHLPPDTATQFRPGAAVDLFLENGQKVPATVEFVSPVIDAASKTVHVKFVIPNPTGSTRSGERCALGSENRGSFATTTTRPSRLARLSDSDPLSPAPIPAEAGNIDPLPPARRIRGLAE
jgi:RND family efflux transporter MFP subunit